MTRGQWLAAIGAAVAMSAVLWRSINRPASGPAPAVTAPSAPAPAPEPADRTTQNRPEVVGVQSGVQHPPIPANSPAWRHDPGGFVPDHNFYGERSWDGVRMRVAGHIAVMERDRARLAAQLSGDRAAAAAVYRSLAADLDALIPPTGGPETKIPTLARDAARRDAALLEGSPVADVGGVAGVRAALHRHTRRGSLTPEIGAQLRSDLAAVAASVDFPSIDAFADFDDRHAMRVRLWALYLDAVDPLEVTEPWGYFDSAAHRRMIGNLDRQIARAVGLSESPEKPQRPQFTVEGLGGMPTGDSLIDVAGQPGPKAIGTLEKLSLDDPAHRQWVEDTAFVLNAKLRENPGGVLAIVHTRAAHLDGMGHGSRYYNIKQLRNEAVRQLAVAGHHSVARQVLQMNFPLHHQDWECPNREGILMTIDARLLAAVAPAQARDRVVRARAVTDAFLAEVNSAEAATR